MKKRLRLLTSRTASIITFLVVLLGSQFSLALGLGDIKAESALNEPLVAKIELLNVSSLSDRDLIVDIGSKEDYRVAGVERDFFHTDLTLEAFVDGQGKPYISVTSTKPVLEPFVNFVVQIRWPQGKLLREYTILLDLPVFTGRSQQQKMEAPKAASTPAQNRKPTQSSRVPAPKKPVKTSRPVVNAGGQYLVENGDTLWSLSGSIAKDTGATRQQVMLAIRDGNPNAFMNGDPNALKAGVVLRMPDQNQAGQRSASDAAEEFANLQKRSGRALEATPVRSSSNNFREQQSASASSAGRLALTSSAALGAGNSAGADNSASTAGDNLSGTLLSENEVLKEELDRVAVENGDLREKVALLEELVEKQQEAVELLSLDNNELAAVQEGLKSATEIADESVPEQEGLAEEVAQQDQASDAEAIEVAEAASEPPSSVAQAEIIQPEPAQEASLLDTLLGFLPYIGAGLIVILLVTMMILKRRKASSEDDDLLADDLESEMYDEDEDSSLDDELEQDEEQPEEDTAKLADDAEDDDEFGDGMESMDELFAEDVDAEGSSEDADEPPAEETPSDIEDVADEDVEDIDLEGALEDLDEFADLDSFFDSDDIEDFDPDAAEGFDDAEESSSDSPGDNSDDGAEAEEDEFSETVIASAEDLDAEVNEEDQAEQSSSDDSNEMDFESFELPEEDSSADEGLDDLHDEEHSMDFDDEIELPEVNAESDEDPLDDSKEDSANSMEFDLDDFDPIGDADDSSGSTDEESEPAGNEMEFDAESIELPEAVEEEPVEDLHDEEHSMDFDDEIELPEVEDETPAEDDSENSMAFDIGDLDLPGEEPAEADDEDLSGLDPDVGLGDSDEENVSDLTDALEGDLEGDMDELLADFDDQGDEESADDSGTEDAFDLSGVDLGDDSESDESLELGEDLDLGEDLGSDESLDLGEDLDIDGDLNLDEGLDLDDDLLADFGEDADGGDLEEEMNTKLELAEAYVEMVDIRGAKELISEILNDGNDEQKEAAQKLSERIEGLG